MTQRKQFYHGSIVKDLNVVLANAKSHVDRSNVAYFTTDCVYALICCRSREENFVTKGLRDGIQHYYERFPDQLKIMYDGKEGFIYCPKFDVQLINTVGYTWESGN